MPKKTKPKRGGARPGAGRPKTLPDSKMVGVRLPLTTVAAMEAKGESPTEAVRRGLAAIGY